MKQPHPCWKGWGPCLTPSAHQWWKRTLTCLAHHPVCLLLRQPCSAYKITSFTFITAKYPVQMVLSAEANKEHISAVYPIFFTSTFRMCDVQGHTTHTQKPTLHRVKHQQCPRVFPVRADIKEGFIGIGCLIKEKTDFSKHPVNARKREEWKGNERSNLERRTEKQETLAPGRELTTVSALPSSIEDVCFY